MKEDLLVDVRRKNPLIHHLTNQVVMNFSANGLLAFGGSPIMAKAQEEVHEIARMADGVLINIGTLVKHDLPAMIKAGKTANEVGIPVVLDPVGVAATPYRRSAVEDILTNVKVTLIKGNAGELAHLVDIPWQTKGVESIDDGDTEKIARKVSEKFQTTAVVTGQTDVICTKDQQVIKNQSGHIYLTKITGAGCLLGSILTACLTTDDPIEKQAFTAVNFFGLAAEYAATHSNVSGPGTFLPHFLDALSYDFETLERKK